MRFRSAIHAFFFSRRPDGAVVWSRRFVALAMALLVALEATAAVAQQTRVRHQDPAILSQTCAGAQTAALGDKAPAEKATHHCASCLVHDFSLMCDRQADVDIGRRVAVGAPAAPKKRDAAPRAPARAAHLARGPPAFS